MRRAMNYKVGSFSSEAAKWAEGEKVSEDLDTFFQTFYRNYDYLKDFLEKWGDETPANCVFWAKRSNKATIWHCYTKN